MGSQVEVVAGPVADLFAVQEAYEGREVACVSPLEAYEDQQVAYEDQQVAYSD